MLSQVVHGVRFRDDLDRGTTMIAHNLHSLSTTESGLDKVMDSYHGLADRGWIAKSTGMKPLCGPCRDCPAGATERKRLPGELEPQPPRLVIDQGHPHDGGTQDLFTLGSGEKVQSLNASIGRLRHKASDENPK